MTTATKKYASELHFEHQVWMQEMNFYKEQLVSFRNRLEEIAGKYSQQDVLQHLEHFQNQFILQNEQADILLHDLKGHEQLLVDKAKENTVAYDHKTFTDHGGLRERVEMFIRLFRELRNDYMKFLSKYM